VCALEYKKMIPVPLTKVEELIETLKPYMDQTQQLDAFTLHRYKREAIENRQAYPWAGFMALGMIAVLEWDEAALDENYHHALGLRNDWQTRSSYSTALQLIGKYESAMFEAIRASDMNPGNLTLLKNAIDYAQGAGFYRVADDLLKKIETRSSASQFEAMGMKDMNDIVGSALSVIQNTETSEEIVASSHRIAFRILRENKTPYTGTRIQTDVQDNFVMYYIDIDECDDVIDRLDGELGVALFDELPDFDPNTYWIGYGKAITQ
jgi:hypothetical protein